MKTALVFVASLDGKVTRWGDPLVRKWSSKEDKTYFSNLWKESELIVMGSKTFTSRHVKPSANHLIVIMTKAPAEYQEYEVPGMLEFSDLTPTALTSHFENENYEFMLVLGGPHIATAFLKEQLVDELWLTIEPRIFGTGGNFVIEEKLDIDLALISCEKVNERGTLLTKYSVMKKETAMN